jgi:uncharacterized protein (TIGR02145 family)
MTGLTGGTFYYVRAYATNSAGTGYGNQVTFSTKLADADGNSYNTVVIGTQLWMAENLKTTKLNDGTTAIANVTDNTAWSLLTTPGYCWYDNDEATNKPLYGAMYNWFTVNTGTLCPTGWHVPTDVEYNTMELYLGIAPADINLYGYRGTDQGSQLKNTAGWPTGQNGTNTSGFTALPGGYRYFVNGSFQANGEAGSPMGYFWSATENTSDVAQSWYRMLDGTAQSYRGAVEKAAGKSVRCVKN